MKETFIKKSCNNVFGFTLMEMTITLIVIAVAATLVIPKLTDVFEEARAAQGEHILHTILDAQLEYAVHNDINIADLKTQSGVSGQNIETLNLGLTYSQDFPVVSGQIDSNGVSYAGSVTRRRNGENLYTLYITWDGEINCGGNTEICTHLKYVPASL